MTFTGPIKRDALTIAFLGVRNCRATLMAEALLRAHGMPGVRPFSAGVTPADGPDRLAIAALAQLGVDYDGLWPKHWRGFSVDRSVRIDTWVVIGASRLPSSLFRRARTDPLRRWDDPFVTGCPKHLGTYVECAHRLNAHIVRLLNDAPMQWPLLRDADRSLVHLGD